MSTPDDLLQRIAILEAFAQEQGQALIQAREYIQSMIHPGKVSHCHQQCETPMVILHRVWALLTPEDQRRFLEEQSSCP